MSDLISREAALEAIDRIRHEVWLIDIPSPTVPEYIEHHEGIKHVLEEIDALRKKMEQLPGIDEQKNGKWIPNNDSGRHETRFMCSVCGESDRVPTIMGEPIWRYCPWCGAKMEGEQDG